MKSDFKQEANKTKNTQREACAMQNAKQMMRKMTQKSKHVEFFQVEITCSHNCICYNSNTAR